jgi:hypothetical protein
MPRRACTVVGLFLVAFVTIGADGCNEALDTWSPPGHVPPSGEVPPSGDGWTWSDAVGGWVHQDTPEPVATAGPAGSGDTAYSIETPGPSSAATPAPSTPQPTAQEPTAAPTPDFSGEEVVLFSNSNPDGIRDGATKPATLVIDAPTLVTYVQTYHWHGGKGAKPGTISISGPDGIVYGPWKAKGTDGQGGVKNAYWEVAPKVVLAPGTYLVDDSAPGTRGTNDAMGGVGQTIVRGILAAP